MSPGTSSAQARAASRSPSSRRPRGGVVSRLGRLGGRHVEEAPEPRPQATVFSSMVRLVGPHAPATHVLGERGHRQLLRDLRLADERSPLPRRRIRCPSRTSSSGAARTVRRRRRSRGSAAARRGSTPRSRAARSTRAPCLRVSVCLVTRTAKWSVPLRARPHRVRHRTSADRQVVNTNTVKKVVRYGRRPDRASPTARELNRALLARQLLLERVSLPIPRVLERIGGIQNQYAPNGYIRLWSSIEGFERDDLTRALARRSVIQGTLMRETIHLVSRRDYPLFAAGIRRSGQEWRLRVDGRADDLEVAAAARQLARHLRGRTISRKELGASPVGGRAGSTWSACLRAARGSSAARIRTGSPPNGSARSRRARATASSTWRGATSARSGRAPEGHRELVEGRPEAAGARARADATAAVPRRGGQGAPRSPPRPAPRPGDARTRAVPATWDATLLVHARRTLILPTSTGSGSSIRRRRTRSRRSSWTARSQGRGATRTGESGSSPLDGSREAPGRARGRSRAPGRVPR